jgi:hypothetical protein
VKNIGLEEDNAMKRIIATTIFLVVSALFAAAQSAKEPYAAGLGEFMTRHSFATPSCGSPAK